MLDEKSNIVKISFYTYLGSVEPIETRHLVIHFHLEDETIELAEDHDINSGRYKAPLFLKRCKIPKVAYILSTYSFRVIFF